MNKIIGFSTGCLYKNIKPVSNEAIELIKLTKSNAIELCAIKPERIDYLKNIELKKLEPLQYVSLHAPDIIYKDNIETHAILTKIQNAQKSFKFSNVVICPNFVENWSIFDNYTLPFAFENMDLRKNFGTTIQDMKKVLKKSDFNMVLDLTHIYTIDKTMNLAKEFCNTFYEKINEIHISGYQIHGSDEQQHYPIFITKQKEILDSILLNVPIIIESVWPNINKENNWNTHLLNELNQELEVITTTNKTNHLKNIKRKKN